MKIWLSQLSLFALLFAVQTPAHSGLPDQARCIAPAKPGGGFDLTCQLTSAALLASGQTQQALPITYQPGGIGALAFRQAVTQQASDANTVIAFSSGSLLNLAQGRFGPYTNEDVRWMASIGLDHGVIAVHQDAPYKNLAQLLSQLRTSPSSIAFGAGGSIGSQDWMKAAMLIRAAGVSHKLMRFVAFEGGGDAITALRGKHVQVLTGDAAEIARHIDQGAPIRVLAVLSEQRLPGRWAQTPTAREQGHDIRWPIIRGLYMGRAVNPQAQREWANALAKAAAHSGFDTQLAKVGLQPAWLAGPELDKMIQHQIQLYRQLALEFGLSR